MNKAEILSLNIQLEAQKIEVESSSTQVRKITITFADQAGHQATTTAHSSISPMPLDELLSIAREAVHAHQVTSE